MVAPAPRNNESSPLNSLGAISFLIISISSLFIISPIVKKKGAEKGTSPPNSSFRVFLVGLETKGSAKGSVLLFRHFATSSLAFRMRSMTESQSSLSVLSFTGFLCLFVGLGFVDKGYGWQVKPWVWAARGDVGYHFPHCAKQHCRGVYFEHGGPFFFWILIRKMKKPNHFDIECVWWAFFTICLISS